MTTAIQLEDITIQSVVEQQGPFFDAMEFFPTLTSERLKENRAWLEPTFIDRSNRLVFCIQSFVVRTPRHNILIDSCVGNHKRRPLWPFWNMMSSDRFETGLADPFGPDFVPPNGEDWPTFHARVADAFAF